ncbi:hypothetical protein [Enterococcus sp. HY326]|uniref:hypothetical protein n=1 Tax=Enterococcus sp. HY326 TaxID=2971265 RepID=UPI00223F60EC|nr:hypothetical protein [Enterococcus sp. HY326]
MKFNLLKKVLVTAGVLAVTFLAGGLKADAAGIDFNTDLKGYDATISTVNGKNVISTKKGTWDLDENSQIYSSQDLKIYLNNTTPVTIDSIYTKKDLEFSGAGELIADTEGQFGLNVGNHLKAFKYTKNGVGKVVATGTEAGMRVENEVQMEGGSIEAYGQQYGLWCNNDISRITAQQSKPLPLM